MSTAYEVAQYLASQSVGTFGGNSLWSIHVAREPSGPDDVITVYDTGGEEPDTDEMDLYRPSFQVRTRSVDYLEGFQKQEAIRSLLILPNSLVMGTHRYVSVNMSSDILPIGSDDNNRYLITANYRCMKEEL
ncbi:MAG: minor capsid protein [Phycisphaerales bacterium]